MLTIVSKESSVNAAIASRIDSHQEEAFFIGDLGEVKWLLEQWNGHLPSITAFYAVKCNPDPCVIRILAQGGAGFDCASMAEIRLVLDLGVDPSQIIFANPCKPDHHIAFARGCGVKWMTFDNSAEVEKISRIYPDAELVLRIATDDAQSQWQLSNKFGAPLDQAEDLLKAAKLHHMDIAGVAFHVGSGCSDPKSYLRAVQDAKPIFSLATSLGFAPRLLDIGGGFLGRNSKGSNFAETATVINAAISDFQMGFPEARIISEPGRYFVTSAFTLAARVCSKRQAKDKAMYYINDGVYGSFNCIYFDHYVPKYQIIRRSEINLPRKTIPACVWGPTCDVIDLVIKETQLPELYIGDWFVFPDMGAYTISSSTNFNGFSSPTVYYINK